jgi:hypothetical protein
MSSNVSDVFAKVLKLSSKVSECKPLVVGDGERKLAESWSFVMRWQNEVGRCRSTP